MNGMNYVIFAYTAGLGAFWGYAALLWGKSRALSRKTPKKVG